MTSEKGGPRDKDGVGGPDEFLESQIPPTGMTIRNVSLTGLFIIALAAALYHGRPLLAPIAVAILLKFLLAPAVRGLEKLRVPNPLGAVLVMAVVMSAIGGIGYSLAGPMSEWLERAPRSLTEVESAVKRWKPKLDEISHAADTVTNLTGPKGDDDETLDVTISDRPPLERAFDSTWPAVANTLIVLILLYFLLAGGDVFVAKLVESMPRMSDKKASVRTVRALETQISAYLITITIINTCLGVAIGLACYLAGLPNPILWGAMAALFNYVPFIGAVVGALVVGLISISTFGVTSAAIFAPSAYLLINGLEGYLITPSVLGRNLSLSPVAVFISMLFWGWAWGLIGVLVAVPMLVIVKIALSGSEKLAPFARFLARE